MVLLSVPCLDPHTDICFSNAIGIPQMENTLSSSDVFERNTNTHYFNIC